MLKLVVPFALMFLLLSDAFAQKKKAAAKVEQQDEVSEEEEAAEEVTEEVPAKKKRKKKKGLIQEISGQGYGMAGCGLGSILFGESESRGIQILSSTTNYTYFNQSFGISSGTSNCAENSGYSSETRMKNTVNYVAGNFEILKNEIAQGNGQTLAGLTSVMGCQGTTEIGSFLQSHYGNIYPEDNNSKVESTYAGKMIFELVSNNQNLKVNCQI